MLTIWISLFLLFPQYQASVETIDNGLVGDPDIECASDAINVNFNTRNPFEGKVYIKGHAEEPGCRVGGQNAINPEDAGNRTETNMKAFGISVPFVKCGTNRKRSLNPVGISVSTVVVVTFHPLFLTKIDRAYEIRCFYMAADKTVSADFAVSELTTGLVTSNLPMPVCRYEVLSSPTGTPVKFANIGDTVYHKWTCDTQTTDIFCVLIHSCFVDDGNGANRAILLDENGCAQDRYLLQNLDYPSDLTAGQQAQVFKYADRPQLFFQCQISILLKDGSTCNRPKCQAPEKGRKKRETGWSDEDENDRPTMDVAADPINVMDIDSAAQQSAEVRFPSPPNWNLYSKSFDRSQAYHHQRKYKTPQSTPTDDVCMSPLAFSAVLATVALVTMVSLLVIVLALLYRRDRVVLGSIPPHPMYGYQEY